MGSRQGEDYDTFDKIRDALAQVIEKTSRQKLIHEKGANFEVNKISAVLGVIADHISGLNKDEKEQIMQQCRRISSHVRDLQISLKEARRSDVQPKELSKIDEQIRTIQSKSKPPAGPRI